MSSLSDFGFDSKYKCEHPVLLPQCNIGVGKSVREQFISCSAGSSRSKVSYRFRFSDPVSVPLLVRCGKCPNCRKFQNDMWFVRCCHHLAQNEHSSVLPCFVTFTISPVWMAYFAHKLDLCPDGDGRQDFRPLYNEIFVNLKKRLRAERGENLKFDYFLVSELGKKRGRFHFHCVFYFYNLHSSGSSFDIRRDQFIKDYGSIARHWVVNKRENTKRLQDDDEVFLQSLIEKHFSVISASLRMRKKVRDGVPHVRKGKNGKRSVYYNGQLGYVTLFSAFSFGAFKYILNYSMKCLHDGVSTFRRFSPRIGFHWCMLHFEQIFDGLLSFVPVGKKPDGSSFLYPIPRAYLKWCGDRRKQLDFVFRTGVRKAINFMIDSSPSIEVEFDGCKIRYPQNINQSLFSSLCTKFV